ncbi:conjugal transfer protein TraA [Eggerthia catenaformis]|uniref:SF1B family DNA helicase RecD2 n=1 Tax=Eggerthia catenaformis TaxID=31973 RepID=UPI000A37EFB9|nr:conjugal transfer protein TraA [Eggerthia catenaformis]
MQSYTGTIIRIRFYSEETKFIVAQFETTQENKPITITGNMSYVSMDERYLIEGEYVFHPRYGKQFKLSGYEVLLANDSREIIRYLSSSLFKGIGEKQAKKIVDYLGEECLSMIKEDPSCLNMVEGMTEKKIQTISQVLKSQDYDQELLNLFMGHGISSRYLEMIQSVYKEKTLSILQTNPYMLIEDIEGIGFKSADSLAFKLGFEKNHPYRLKAAISYSLMTVCFQSGSIYTSKENLYKQTGRLVPIALEDFENYLSELIEEEKIVYENDNYYTYDLYHSELTIASDLRILMNRPEIISDKSLIDKRIDEVQEYLGIRYDRIQRQAIHSFLKSSVMILTGGPGTGKTTIVRGIMRVYRSFFPDHMIDLCAPTGRAAKRLEELTHLETSTIHRLLKWDLHKNTFAVNKKNPLDTRLMIVDEFSMVDSLLFARLLEAGTHLSKLLIIGDDKQLPSVSPGQVLNDLLETGQIETVRLNTIYRQKEDSGIVELAHDIRNDRYDERIFEFYPAIHFINCLSYEVLKHTVSIVLDCLERGYQPKDIQVLSPMYQGIAGVDSMNEILQNLMNPKKISKQELKIGSRLFREGDKLLQLKNRPDDNIYNGDIGTLIEIMPKEKGDLSETLIVEFDDGNYVEYVQSDFSSLTPAYAMTIHKSQGSEFPVVIMPVLSDFSIMNRKNLLYTGMTRAKKELYLLGSQDVLKASLKKQAAKRHTSLKERFNYPMLKIEDFE